MQDQGGPRSARGRASYRGGLPLTRSPLPLLLLTLLRCCRADEGESE